MDATSAQPGALREHLRSRLSSGAPHDRSTLVASKLTVPPPHRSAIRRSRNERLLTDSSQLRLVLVAAPAGYGKTTLVTSWLADQVIRVAWVSLDSDDDDPQRFWAYVVAALARCGVVIELPDEAEQRHTWVSNALAALTEDVVLVLDDYHCVTSGEIHRDLASLIEQHLPLFHLMLLTRSDPPFVRSRWKANGAMAELRVRDLAFDEDEMALFLDDVGVSLSADVRSSLFARVDGWPAAMRLVTLWVSGQKDPEAAMSEFVSSDATISDYLVNEVLAQLPSPLRRFLVRTSILAKLTGALCDAVTGEPGGSENLRALQRRDLFVQSLDRGHAWVRYHPLFRELLANELRRTDPNAVPELHRRASAWFVANDDVQQAIKHAVLAADWANVRALLLAETLAIGSRYPPSTVDGWLSALPAPVVQSSAFFQTLRGYLLATMGHIPRARRALARALAMTDAGQVDADLPELSALVHAILAGVSRLECDLVGVQRAAHAAADELEQRGNGDSGLAPMVRAIADTARIGALFWEGRLAECEQLLDAVETDVIDHRLHRMRVNTLSSKALLLATRGRLREAADLAPRVLELAKPVGVAAFFQTTPAHLALAIVSMQRGDRIVARSELALAANRARRHHDRGPLVATSVLTVRLLADDGEPSAALALLDDARSQWPGRVLPHALDAMIATEEVRLSLLIGEVRAARAINARIRRLDDTVPAVQLAHAQTHALLLLDAGDNDAASDSFAAAAEVALVHRLVLASIELFVAAAAGAASDPSRAGAYLDRALSRASDENIVAPFVAEAAVLRPLLHAGEGRDEDIARMTMRRKLLGIMGSPPRPSTTEHAELAPRSILSDRESVVLHMLRGTLTNAEIAAGLAISPNTLKTHVKNIHRKLGATSRQEVLERANELGLH